MSQSSDLKEDSDSAIDINDDISIGDDISIPDVLGDEGSSFILFDAKITEKRKYVEEEEEVLP
jgi:hypothetical protein